MKLFGIEITGYVEPVRYRAGKTTGTQHTSGISECGATIQTISASSIPIAISLSSTCTDPQEKSHARER